MLDPVVHRVFHVDVGNLPRLKAEQYIKEFAAKHKVSNTIKDKRYVDYFIPMRDNGPTKIELLIPRTMTELEEKEIEAINNIA